VLSVPMVKRRIVKKEKGRVRLQYVLMDEYANPSFHFQIKVLRYLEERTWDAIHFIEVKCLCFKGQALIESAT